jgi:hypothetical protein
MAFHSHLLLSYLVKQPNVLVKKKTLAELIATAYFLSSEKFSPRPSFTAHSSTIAVTGDKRLSIHDSL